MRLRSSPFQGFAPSLMSVCLAVFVFAGSVSAELTAKSTKLAPPKGVSDAIKGTLSETCYQVVKEGKPLFDFWLSEQVPLKEAPSSPDKSLDTPTTAALLGVVKIHKELRDYRDDELYQGVFTMRYGKIPADGNHLGASEYPYFAVLIPVAIDQTLDGITSYKKMTRASSKETASEHPMIMSLRPSAKKPEAIPALTEPIAEHQCLVVTASGRAEGADQTSELLFEIVVEGFGEI